MILFIQKVSKRCKVQNFKSKKKRPHSCHIENVSELEWAIASSPLGQRWTIFSCSLYGLWILSWTEILLFCIAKTVCVSHCRQAIFHKSAWSRAHQPTECNTNWNLGYRDTVGHRMKLKPLMVSILLCLQCSSVRCFPFVSFRSIVLFFLSRLSQPGRLVFNGCW